MKGVVLFPPDRLGRDDRGPLAGPANTRAAPLDVEGAGVKPAAHLDGAGLRPKLGREEEPAHLAIQPFGQIPTYEEDGLALFESGAILLHLGGRHPGLLPQDPAARATAWMFAALATVEPPIVELEVADLLERGEDWYGGRRPAVQGRVRDRLGALARRLGNGSWLDGAFSAADILMVHALLRLDGTGLLEEHPDLIAYVDRARARPAYGRAFAAQRAVFLAAHPPG